MATNTPLDARQIQFLQQQGFSSGLIQAVATCRHAFPLRIWLLDNSLSMNVKDSHRISGTFDNLQNIPVTRWEELQDCVAYHSQLAALFTLPTRFALLNDPGVGPQYFSVGEHGAAAIPNEMGVVNQVMTQTRPGGSTPLTEQVAGLVKYITSIAPKLRQHNQTVSIVLATQGRAGVDPQFVHTLRSLEGLPVWVVLRLCTDDETTFDFYNSLDAQLNLPYDVLDDFFGESLEVFLKNPWLTYALPLHRFRELGFRFEVLDAIDERALNIQELRGLCSLLFATPQLPDPNVNWNAFFQAISSLVAREKQQWNPVTRKLAPWINLHEINRLYGPAAHAPPQTFPFTSGYHQTQQMPQQQVPHQQPYPPAQQQRPSQQKTWQQQQQQQVPPAQQASWQQQQQQHPTRSSYQQPAATQSQGFQPQQPRPTPPQALQQPAPPPPPSDGDSMSALKKSIMTQWALQPPNYQAPRPIHYLLGTVNSIFPPAFGVEPHDYFLKWKPLSLEALSSGQDAVLKRAIRKMKFFLHPDKLPKDLTEKQSLLFKTIWDVTADAVEAAEK